MYSTLPIRNLGGSGDYFNNIHNSVSIDGTNLPGDACLVLTTDPKPRLRWTTELHERFVDAVTQLGGPDSKSLIFLFFSFFPSDLSAFSFSFLRGNRKKLS